MRTLLSLLLPAGRLPVDLLSKLSLQKLLFRGQPCGGRRGRCWGPKATCPLRCGPVCGCHLGLCVALLASGALRLRMPTRRSSAGGASRADSEPGEQRPATVRPLSAGCALAQPCLCLCSPGDHSPPGSSVHGTLQERTLERAAMPSSGGSS